MALALKASILGRLHIDPGLVRLVMEFTDGQSEGAEVEVIAAPGLAPSMPSDIVIPPGRARNDDTFPIVTLNPFPSRPTGEVEPTNWVYTLQSVSIAGTLGYATDVSFCRRGTISGQECYFSSPRLSPANCDDSDAIHPLTGYYALDAATNRVEVIIDRSGSGGRTEMYEGGWIMADGGLPDSSMQNDVDLVLTSQATGYQLRIAHLFGSQIGGGCGTLLGQ